MKWKSTARRAVAIAVAVVVAAGMAGCSASGTTPSQDGRAAKLTMQFGGVPISLDPAISGPSPFINPVYESLIFADSEGKLVPELATDWKFTDDTNTRLELTIRDGVTFQDGSPLDAKAVADSMNYYLKAGVGRVDDEGRVTSVDVVDDHTVAVTYAAPYPAGPSRLTQRTGLGIIIGPKGVADPDSLLTTMDGTGPYIYNPDKSIVESSYVFDRNKDYWNTKAQMYDQVEVKVIADPQAVMSAVTTGQVDFATGTPDTAEAVKAAGMNIVTAPYFNWGLIILDRNGEKVPALADAKVRQAMALAIDRKAVADAKGGQDYNQVIGQITADGELGHLDDYGFDFDIAAAKKLMAESGYPDGFTLKVGAAGPMDAQSTLTQAALANLGKIGITVDLAVEAAVPSFIDKAGAKDYPAIVWPIVGDTASDYATTYTGLGFTNAFGINDPELTKLIGEAQSQSDPAKLKDIEEQITKRSNDLGWFLPLIATTNIYYVSPKIANFKVSAANPTSIPFGPTPEYSWQPAKG